VPAGRTDADERKETGIGTQRLEGEVMGTETE